MCVPKAPVAIKFTPFHAIPIPDVNSVVDTTDQVTPSVEYAIQLLFPDVIPTATNLVPFHAIPLTSVKAVGVVPAVQVLPSVEVATTFVPDPPATNLVPFQQTATAFVVKIAFPFVEFVQAIPSGDVISTFVPSPAATNLVPLHVTPFPLVKNVFPTPLFVPTQVNPSFE